MSRFHVSQIETHIRDRYSRKYWNSDLDDPANLSRLLALHAVSVTFGGSADDDDHRVVEITDGGSDRGIDAIGIDVVGKLVVFVQSKWRQDGTGSMALGDILKFLDGTRALLGMGKKRSLTQTSIEIRNAIHEILRTPGARMRLVTATTAGEALSDAVEEPVSDLLAQINDVKDADPLVTHVHLGQTEFFKTLAGHERPAINLDLHLQDWGRATDPLRIFYGRVNAADIARWYKDHGDDLFADNIRVVIPRSDVNEGILNTIREEPERFVYYNNGVTILASAIDIGPAGALNREVGYLRLSSASVVNGAQTVSTLGKVLDTDSENALGQAFVLIRCIEVPSQDKDLGLRITRFANTQNEVSSQDFAFLDPQQHRLVEELRVLGYEYLLRSAEEAKSNDPSKVVDVRQAAVALACCSPNFAHVMLAKREVSRLFSEDRIYVSLFNPGTDALRLVRAVDVLRAVTAVLRQIEAESTGVEAGVASHGQYVISHVVMRNMGDGFLKSIDSDFHRAMLDLEGIVRDYHARLVAAFPDNSYAGNLFKNQSRSRFLVETVGFNPQ